MPPSSFASLGESLARAGAACDAAEAHGIACGALCVAADTGEEWLTRILDQATGNAAQQQACRKELLALRDEARMLLLAGTLEFALYLPDDEARLGARTAALAEWCQGFLFGMGLGGERLRETGLADEAGEVLRDMGEIAKAGFEGDAGSEQDEADYAEIVEYVRVGVQLLFEELRPAGQPMPPSATVH